MSGNVLILMGSPRERGNSAALARRAAAGAEAAGAKVESVYLHGLDIRACDGCDLCEGGNGCVVNDDMQDLYPKVAAADA
ncbi:MAG: NAD(P)H-dependent oxidoreductase, partial [Chloroflexi bacterium]|nr:NAD(P)H-dependent oxidoreductase [Chloroflexota bacterium]